ncbi:MAG: signal peptidase II [Dissulfuribacterales bacterium]
MEALQNKYVKLACISGLVVILDQITKWAVARSITLYDVIELIPGFFNLIHIQNTGGAFGVFAGRQNSLQSLVFVLISIAAMCLIVYLYKNTPEEYPILSFGFSLIFGGAMGNMIDRIRFGRVTDFIDLYIGNLHWPAFNIADSAITVGMIIFGFYIIFRKMPV